MESKYLEIRALNNTCKKVIREILRWGIKVRSIGWINCGL
jgi:hypothetical protein